MPGASCKALATQNSSEWPCSLCPFPPGSGLWGWGHPIYIFLIFPGHLEFWTPLQIPSWGPPLGCTLLQVGPSWMGNLQLSLLISIFLLISNPSASTSFSFVLGGFFCLKKIQTTKSFVLVTFQFSTPPLISKVKNVVPSPPPQAYNSREKNCFPQSRLIIHIPLA